MIVCANVQVEQFYCSLRDIALILAQTKEVFTGVLVRENLPKKTKRYKKPWI
jgi:hypothetical protein